MDLKRHRTPSSIETILEFPRGLTDNRLSDEQLQRYVPPPGRLAQFSQAQNAYCKHSNLRRHNQATGLNGSVDSCHLAKLIRDRKSGQAREFGCLVCERRFTSLMGANQHMDVMGHWNHSQSTAAGLQYMKIVAPKQKSTPDGPWSAMPDLQRDLTHNFFDPKNQYPESGTGQYPYVIICSMIVNKADFENTGISTCETCERSFSTPQGANQHMDVKQHWSKPQDQQRPQENTSIRAKPNPTTCTHKDEGIKPPKFACLVEPVISFTCDTCKRAFGTEDAVNQHMAAKGHLNAFDCDICGLEFRTRGRLKQHRATHPPPLPATKHETDVHSEREFPCEVCRLDFTTAEDTDKHMAEVHFCKECGGLITTTNLHMECSMLYVENFWQSQYA
ncbi:uncharacterized protein N7511_006334 [Penicillium nucicola]|uniref:uncharacterized protein n=1 Tax=Penicillium nucicola TaxID=1850975 RepID=UPI00254540A2|nr:uncharacterized protein N7511_006334 [Penicillium nucicola]KAJ5757640.1 hypothetical protein N7511_006334 [Penicillium nucicola]